MQSSDLMALWNRQWREGERRKAVYRERGEEYGRDYWMISPNGTQVNLWEFLVKRVSVFTIVPLDQQRDSGYRCWVDGRGQGLLVNGQCTDEPIPDEAIDTLKQALPAPPPLSFWGQRHEGVLVALYQLWEDDSLDLDTLCSGRFVLRDSPRSEMLDTKGYLDLRKWWAAVDRGTLENIGEKVVQASNPVLSVKRGNGIVRSVEINEPWTGIDGPALYVYQAYGRKDAPLTKAQLRGAVDVRQGFTVR